MGLERSAIGQIWAAEEENDRWSRLPDHGILIEMFIVLEESLRPCFIDHFTPRPVQTQWRFRVMCITCGNELHTVFVPSAVVLLSALVTRFECKDELDMITGRQLLI